MVPALPGRVVAMVTGGGSQGPSSLSACAQGQFAAASLSPSHSPRHGAEPASGTSALREAARLLSAVALQG